MPDKILSIPYLPAAVREASVRGTLIPFVGAGASRIAGCPGWPAFADRALTSLVKDGKFSHAQLSQVNLLNPKVKFSLARALEREHGVKISFSDLLHPGGCNDPKGRRLYAALAQLGKSFVTTNYDLWLHEDFTPSGVSAASPSPMPTSAPTLRRKAIYKPEDFLKHLGEPDTVTHLHGCVIDPDSMVMSSREYVDHYANDRHSGDPDRENRVLSFLEELFNKAKTVLFVGYGLEELEILEYVMLKARRSAKHGPLEAKHFLLQGFFSHELELMRSLRRYYLEEFGVGLIAFSRDQKDWDQLIDVLEDFGKQAPATSPLVLQELLEMKGLLDA
jgi:hypothetical protein